MTRVIWRYTVDNPYVTLLMPEGARFVAAGYQNAFSGGRISVWADVDPEAKLVRRRVACLNTGTTREDEGAPPTYIGLVQVEPEGLSWHLLDYGEIA